MLRNRVRFGPDFRGYVASTSALAIFSAPNAGTQMFRLTEAAWLLIIAVRCHQFGHCDTSVLPPRYSTMRAWCSRSLAANDHSTPFVDRIPTSCAARIRAAAFHGAPRAFHPNRAAHRSSGSQCKYMFDTAPFFGNKASMASCACFESTSALCCVTLSRQTLRPQSSWLVHCMSHSVTSSSRRSTLRFCMSASEEVVEQGAAALPA